jgi:putative sugar O-methyltransferase
MIKSSSNKTIHIPSDNALLDTMIEDAKNAKDIYRPGPYWANSVKSAANEIKRHGLSDFRGQTNGIANSYGDNAYVDTRGAHNYGVKGLFIKFLKHIYPIDRLFNSQISQTIKYFEEMNKYLGLFLQNHDRVKQLLLKYKIDFDTTRGGCLSFGDFGGVDIAYHYLQLLDTLDTLDTLDGKSIIKNKKTFFEIGGGFGANVHLIIELFKIRKIIYLDIAPNLYVGTQYLKSFYGSSVVDYRDSKSLKEICFTDNKELEIFCILPQQIETITSSIDLFHNAHSFVEMPSEVVENYAEKLKKIMSPKNSAISLVSYSGYDPNTTIDPRKLPTFFEMPVTKKQVPTLNPSSQNFHFIFS